MYSAHTSSHGGKKPQLKIGCYIFGQTVGHGTFGKVKLAKHELTGHQVAVKILNKQKIKNLDVAEKIHREIQILKLFRHPHIIKLYEVIPTATDIFLILEFVAGGELFEYIVRHGKSTEKEARAFFQQIISGVDYCHGHKVVHRDLKPENILLDSKNQVKIADFGLSNIIKDGELLKTSCGSPNYAAPEVVSGKLYAGPEVDVWSCGIILYALLCGSLPFDDPNITALFKKIKTGHFKIPTYLSPGAVDLLTSMLQVNPVKRTTVQQIKEHGWFQQDLPDYLFPKRIQISDNGAIDVSVVNEVCQKIGVSMQEVVTAIQSGNPHNQLNIAYHLILDNTRMSHSETTGSSLPTFLTKEWETIIQSKEFSQMLTPVKKPYQIPKPLHPPYTSYTVHTVVHSPSLPSTLKKSRWHLGIRSQSRPQDIMTEIFRKMMGLNYHWKVITPYHVLVKYDVPTKENLSIKLDLQLYQIDQRNYLLDLKNAMPSSSSESRSDSGNKMLDISVASDTQEELKHVLSRRHYTMEFFEISSLLIQALSQ